MALLSVEEHKQGVVIQRFLDGELSEAEACDRLGLHRATLWRKVKRVQSDGPGGLAHRLRGRAGNRGTDQQLRAAVCSLFETDYQPHGFRVAHFYEEASPRFPKPVSYATVVRWFRAALARHDARQHAGDEASVHHIRVTQLHLC